ncbi:unnamed protein product, partial [Ostreobium quekettii]
FQMASLFPRLKGTQRGTAPPSPKCLSASPCAALLPLDPRRAQAHAQARLPGKTESFGDASPSSAPRSMQIFVKSLRGASLPLLIGGSESASELKATVEDLTGVPAELQRLLFAGRDLDGDSAPLSLSGLRHGATVHLALRLPGGKGGFGALLRGQGRDGKITTNFDACRDLSGRRLRHVNAEKALEEWAAAAKERELEELGRLHAKQREREEAAARRKEVDVDGMRQQRKAAMDGVKAAVAAGLSRDGAESSKRPAGSTALARPNNKKPKFYFPDEEIDDDDGLSSDADDSCNNDGSAVHSIDHNNDCRDVPEHEQEQQENDGSEGTVGVDEAGDGATVKVSTHIGASGSCSQPVEQG